MLDVAQPFELMPNPFCCTEFLRVVHHHKRLIFITSQIFMLRSTREGKSDFTFFYICSFDVVVVNVVVVDVERIAFRRNYC